MKLPCGLRPSSYRILAPLCAMILPPALSAATIEKANNNDALNVSTSWQAGALPLAADTVRWSSIVTGPTTVSTGTNVSYAGIIVTDPAGAITISDNTITLGASGIDMSAATQDLTIDSTLSLTAAQNWSLNAGRSITIGGGFTFSTGIVTQAGGTVTLQGSANNFGRRFIVGGSEANPGLLILNKASTVTVVALASSETALVINVNGTVRLDGTGGNQISNSAEVDLAGGTLNMNGLTETIDGLIGTSAGVVTNGAAGKTAVLTVGSSNHDGAVAGATTYAGTLRDGAGPLAFTKAGNGLQILNGTLSHTGQTTISGGVLRVDTPSGLTTSNLLLAGGILQTTATSAGAFANLTLGAGAGQIRFGTANSGGFSAQGANASFTLNGDAPLTWGQADFIQSNQALVFGGTQSAFTATLTNALNLSASTGANGTLRTVTVNESGAAFEGELSGPVTGDGTLVVSGAGGLRLSDMVANHGGIIVNSGVVGYDPATVTSSIPVQVAASGAVAYLGADATLPASFYQNLNGVGSSTTVAATDATNIDFNLAPVSVRNELSLGAIRQNDVVNFTGTLVPVENTYRLGGGGGILSLTVPNTLTGANRLAVRNGGVARIDNAAQGLRGAISINGGVLELRGDNANISGAGGIVVNGVGSLSSQGAPTGYGFSGAFFNRLRGGVLSLQSLKDPTGAVIGTQTVTLRGGAIAAHDSDADAGTILVQNVTADSGYNMITHQPQEAGSNHDQLTITNLTRTAGAGATIEFRSQYGPLATATGDGGNIAITNLNGAPAANANGILGGWAYAAEGGEGMETLAAVRNFATLTANGVDVATPNYFTPSKPLPKATALDNVLVRGTGLSTSVDPLNIIFNSTAVNSLITESSLDVRNNAVLTIGTGGLIMRDNYHFLGSFDGTGKITSGLPSGELFVFAAEGMGFFNPLESPAYRISTLSIVDNGGQAVSLVKTGPDKLVLGGTDLHASGFAVNTFSGKVIVNLGTLEFDFSRSARVLPGGDVIVRSGGIFSTGLAMAVNTTLPNNVFLDGGILRNENPRGIFGDNEVVTYTGTIEVASLPGSSAGIDSITRIILGPNATLKGSGDLTKAGGSPLEIQTAKTSGFTGGLTLSAGTVEVTGEGRLPVTDLVFGGGTLNVTTTQQAANSISGTAGTISGVSTSGTDSLTVNQNIDTTFHGAISNTVLVKNGTGHLYLTGSVDNGAGGIVVNEGLVSLAKASTNGVHTAGGGTSLTINGGMARLGGTFTDVSGSGNKIPPAGVPENYVDQIHYQATIALNAGSLDMNGRSESFNGLTGATGGITNSAAGTTSRLYTGQENASSSFGGSIQDGAGIVGYVKLGTGTQTFTGVSTYTGATEVRAGTLSIQGSLSGSTVEVKGGATLAGTGSILGLTTESLANVSPGEDAPGILEVIGSALLNGGTLSLQINGLTAGTQYEQLAANSVSLMSDVDLALTLGFTPTPFVDSFVIVSNTGANPIGGPGLFTVNGTRLANGDRFFIGQDEFQIAYNGGTGGNDVVLQAVPEPSAAVLLAVGAALGFARRRRHN